MLSGVGKGAGSESVTWAMSAIGLAGGDSSQLAAISEELQEIDAELQDINATLTAILDAIEEQTCTETQIAPSLQDAVNDITQLYNDCQVYLDHSAMDPPVPPSQAEVTSWQSDVLANVSGDLNEIDNGVHATVNTNVIDECATATAADYIGVAKNNETFFDDRPSYSELIDIVNYYYGVQVQGATMLAEAYHLRACQAAAEDDPDLHCDFTTPSTSTSASDVAEICDDPTETAVQKACLAAQETVTEPDTGTGMRRPDGEEDDGGDLENRSRGRRLVFGSPGGRGRGHGTGGRGEHRSSCHPSLQRRRMSGQCDAVVITFLRAAAGESRWRPGPRSRGGRG